MCSQAQHQTSVWWGLMWPRLKEHRTHRETLGCHARTSREHHRWEARGNEGKAAKMAAHGARWETVALAQLSVRKSWGSRRERRYSQAEAALNNLMYHSTAAPNPLLILFVGKLFSSVCLSIVSRKLKKLQSKKKIFNNLKFRENITLKPISEANNICSVIIIFSRAKLLQLIQISLFVVWDSCFFSIKNREIIF